MREKDAHVFHQKNFWKTHRISLSVVGIFVFFCSTALVEDWSGRDDYLIPPIPAIVFTIILVTAGYIYHRLRNLTVTLEKAAIHIERFGICRQIKWHEIRNIRHSAEGLDLTFGELYLSRFITFEHFGKDIEIPTHILKSGELLHEKFGRYYFES